MKTQNLINEINSLQYNGEGGDNSFYFDYEGHNFYWSSDIKKEWDKAEKEISAIKYKGKNWRIYGWFDISGFEYWRQQEHEPNYIAITISISKETLTKREITAISKYLDLAVARAYEIENTYIADFNELI